MGRAPAMDASHSQPCATHIKRKSEITLIVIVLVSWFFIDILRRRTGEIGLVQAWCIANTLFDRPFPGDRAGLYLVARREEQQVLKQFGDAYRNYRRQVPMFIPRWGSWRQLAAASRASNDDNTV